MSARRKLHERGHDYYLASLLSTSVFFTDTLLNKMIYLFFQKYGIYEATKEKLFWDKNVFQGSPT